jgi:hypothetical protein
MKYCVYFSENLRIINLEIQATAIAAKTVFDYKYSVNRYYITEYTCKEVVKTKVAIFSTFPFDKDK